MIVVYNVFTRYKAGVPKTRNGTIPGFSKPKPGTKKPYLKHETEQNLA
jgi:hypothetical protein